MYKMAILRDKKVWSRRFFRSASLPSITAALLRPRAAAMAHALLLALCGLLFLRAAAPVSLPSWPIRAVRGLFIHEKPEEGSDVFDRVVSEHIGTYGAVRKDGMVPADRWGIGSLGFSPTPFWAFVRNASEWRAREGDPRPPRKRLPHPMSKRCVLWVNHEYRCGDRERARWGRMGQWPLVSPHFFMGPTTHCHWAGPVGPRLMGGHDAQPGGQTRRPIDRAFGGALRCFRGTCAGKACARG
jgi:hypothetical protein